MDSEKASSSTPERRATSTTSRRLPSRAAHAQRTARPSTRRPGVDEVAGAHGASRPPASTSTDTMDSARPSSTACSSGVATRDFRLKPNATSRPCFGDFVTVAVASSPCLRKPRRLHLCPPPRSAPRRRRPTSSRRPSACTASSRSGGSLHVRPARHRRLCSFLHHQTNPSGSDFESRRLFLPEEDSAPKVCA